ncbi:MAG: Nucleotide-binding protein, partial [Actinobacteria bacterium]|nr:Nucleotide-binding protein [Actinomycetota bacterium]
SGSGKSTAAKVFEDLGYFCVDNTPPVLLPKIIDLVSEARGENAKIALVADVRVREFLPDFARVIGDLRRQGHGVLVLFLDADDEVLMRRFSETRRKHPLGGEGGAKEAIGRERKVLAPLREMADTVLNTTRFTVHQLRDDLLRRYRVQDKAGLGVSIISFGYRYGIPLEADMVVDVRFLPNPNFIPGLKHLSGLDRKVRAHVLSGQTTKKFLRLMTSFLHFLIPLYTKEGKAYFTLGIGCTGGRHRSVAIAEALLKILAGSSAPAAVHRDLHRSSGRRGSVP